MRGVPYWLLVLGLVGCVKRGDAVVDAGPPKGHPDLQCPPGALPEGYGPPTGTSVWCVLALPDGRRVKEGPTIEWHANGARSLDGRFAQDQRVGEWVTFHPTGTPETRGGYTANRKEGVWTTWAATGEKIAEGPFVNGVEHGGWTFWNTDTLTRIEGSFVLGAKDGRWLDYSPEGKPTRERIFREGRLITQREL